MKIDEAMTENTLQPVATIYPLTEINSLAGWDAVRKLHVMIEEHALFTTVREAKVTVLNDVPVLITYHLTPEQEELRLRMLKRSHGYWRGGHYHLTYKPRRKRFATTRRN